jgi:6-phosphogluconolactonase
MLQIRGGGMIPSAGREHAMIYLGGYSAGAPDGRIGLAALTDTGLVLKSTVDCAANPSYLTLGPGRRVLYAVHELDEGLVSAFEVGYGGALRPLGSQPSGGAHPCHLSVHPSGSYLLTANYGSGSFSVHPIGPDGSLGAVTGFVETPKSHAHMIIPDPWGNWVLGVNLGTGAVTTFGLDMEDGWLVLQQEAYMDVGAGPRHLAFHPDGDALYVANELHSTVTACRYNRTDGRMEPVATVSTLPAGTTIENHPSAIRVSPDGRFVYLANRLHDSVAVFATAPALRLVATYPVGGEFPRDIALTADGRLLIAANERGDALTGLVVDPTDGSLTPAGWSLPYPAPTCVLP